MTKTRRQSAGGFTADDRRTTDDYHAGVEHHRTAATLSGWIDTNNNGVFDNASERAQIAVPAGTNSGLFTLTFRRFRQDSRGRPTPGSGWERTRGGAKSDGGV